MKSGFLVLLLCVSIVLLCPPTFATQQYVSGSTAKGSNEAVFSTQDCLGCHQTQTKDWQLSDHAKAMGLANEENVLGDFSNSSARHFEQRGLFFKDESVYKATIKDGPEDQGQTFEVIYTFGHYPLQQYLVETARGKLHVLPFAWDTRSKQEGGQRWFHIYDESILANDRLHWRQPLQNWNGMCADCHSDELVRNYKPVEDSFETHYSGINVGCVSCHGTQAEKWGKNHPFPGAEPKPYIAKKTPTSTNYHGQDSNNKASAGHWALNEGDKNVHWSGEARDNSFMDNCFACHALRAPLNDGFKANTPFLDNFSPSLITPPLYHADGQIKEEVYVYGSFLQSKMYEKGVNCLDCHDPHTMKVKIEGNGLCLQCHVADEYETPKHHKHPMASEGAQCVNCHMTDEVYMGVDARRDHSFKIPRPDLSLEFDTPNACSSCHADKSDKWANDELIKWNGKPQALSTNQMNLLKLRHGQPIGLQAHLMIAYDESMNVITRASVIEMLNRSAQQLLSTNLLSFTKHKEALIRLAAARVANLVAPNDRVALLSPLLKDEFKAVRTEAARHLVSLDIADSDINAYRTAFESLLESNENVSWRGEGRVNLSNIWLSQGDTKKAEAELQASVKLDPYFPSSYVNLSDIYRAQAKETLVADILQKGLENNPISADIAYSYGLHKVREKALPEAIVLFKKSMELDPLNPRLAYTYILALDGAGESQRAMRELRALLPKYANNSQELVELGLYLAQKLQSRSDFTWFQQRR